MTQEIIDRGWEGYLKELENDDFSYVDVGVVASDGAQKLPPTGEGKQSDITLAELATIQEFGTQIKVTKKMRGFLSATGLNLSPSTTHITIPSRPFIRGTFDENEEIIFNWVSDAEKEIAAGRETRKSALLKIGQMHQNQIQIAMSTSGKFAPNSDYTKKRKGSSQPLKDKGQLAQSINFEVG